MTDLYEGSGAIRRDNGPEATSRTFANGCREQDIGLRFIRPGKPEQNAGLERLNRTHGEEVQSACLLDSPDESCDITAEWRERYNAVKLHDTPGNLPPARCRVPLLAAETTVQNCLLDGGAYVRHFGIGDVDRLRRLFGETSPTLELNQRVRPSIGTQLGKY
jgi:hypothetical protein